MIISSTETEALFSLQYRSISSYIGEYKHIFKASFPTFINKAIKSRTARVHFLKISTEAKNSLKLFNYTFQVSIIDNTVDFPPLNYLHPFFFKLQPSVRVYVPHHQTVTAAITVLV
ncbi:insulinoma-associated protein 1-like [Platysternon megacephalum]|uniref:Insulinoma-associated protein 1-like n=1 Tax=Platysternon megacephalum TaxID=55544 RepID=A0A4D9ENQ0_9SAUR|nr:insulinoma-associated protein 1-like [Platysternon megacephalum]